MDPERLGAYGLRLPDLPGARPWMVEVGIDCPELAVEWQPVGADDRPTEIGTDRADIRLVGGARLRMTPAEPLAVFSGPRRPAEVDLLHPWLAPAAAVWWHWQDALPVHGGGWQTDAGAVLLLAGKEGGKSTTLAWLSERNCPVISDDLAVIRAGCVLPGPRLLDLRIEPPSPPTTLHGIEVRGGDRRRLTPGGPSHPVELAGVALLEWSTRETSMQPVPVADRLKVVAGHLMIRPLRPSPDELFRLLSVPMVIVRRTPGPAGLEAAGQTLQDYFNG